MNRASTRAARKTSRSDRNPGQRRIRHRVKNNKGWCSGLYERRGRSTFLWHIGPSPSTDDAGGVQCDGNLAEQFLDSTGWDERFLILSPPDDRNSASGIAAYTRQLLGEHV
jgi:hypothetical protein